MTMQMRWRLAGAAALAVAAAMVWFGVDSDFLLSATWLTAAYWGLFVFLLIVAFYCVLLDLRFIRLQFVAGERELFKDTFDNEEFRRLVARELKEQREQERREKQRGPEE